MIFITLSLNVVFILVFFIVFSFRFESRKDFVCEWQKCNISTFVRVLELEPKTHMPPLNSSIGIIYLTSPQLQLRNAMLSLLADYYYLPCSPLKLNCPS